MESLSVTDRMQAQIEQWEADGDKRAIFLSCYRMMTQNMLAAIEARDFHDPAWVDKLLHHFADYYFVALDDYDHGSPTTPEVWQIAFDAARQPATMVLQDLLLGINAHINYDLVLALADVLEADSAPEQQQQRYADHCHINQIIGATVDAVQDQIVARWTPALRVVDKVLGPLDESITTRLITHWREDVWKNAVGFIQARSDEEREWLLRDVAAAARSRARVLRDDPYRLDQIL